MRLFTGFALICATALACSPQENGSGTDSTASTNSTASTASTDSTDTTDSTDSTSTTTDSTAPTGTTDTPGTTDSTGTTGTPDPTNATGTDSSTDTESTSTTGSPVDDDCAFLVGRVFLSDEELECGKGPNGVEMCPWQLTFTADTFDHQLSDFGLQGTYTCVDGVIDAVDMQQNAHGGTIDAATGELVWDQIVYHPKGG